MNYLTAKFSLKMLQKNMGSAIIKIEPIQPEEIPKNVENYISHPNMISVLNNILGWSLGKTKLGTVKIKKGDVLYVATHYGTHLPQFATTLPEGAHISFDKITWQ